MNTMIERNPCKEVLPEWELLNYEALDNPRSGDYWHERFVPYVYVLDVDGDNLTILNFLESNKDLPCAYIDKVDWWEMDFTKSTKVTKQWLKELVMYKSRNNFVADVVYRPGYIRDYLAEVYSPKVDSLS